MRSREPDSSRRGASAASGTFAAQRSAHARWSARELLLDKSTNGETSAPRSTLRSSRSRNDARSCQSAWRCRTKSSCDSAGP
jgi:hypothetical protein